MDLQELKDLLVEQGYEDSVVFDNPSYVTAVCGISENGQVIYDYEKMVEYLMDTDKMSDEDAREFIDYNTIRAIPYAGHLHPIIMYSLPI